MDTDWHDLEMVCLALLAALLTLLCSNFHSSTGSLGRAVHKIKRGEDSSSEDSSGDPRSGALARNKHQILVHTCGQSSTECVIGEWGHESIRDPGSSKSGRVRR